MPEKELYSEKELLLRIGQRDEAAFRVFFDRYKNRLFVFVEQLIHSRADAEEIVQDVFTKVWLMAGTLSEVEYAGQYIYTIARNKTLNYMRKTARDKHLINEAWAKQQGLDHSLEEKLRTAEATEIIEQAVSRLSNQQQTIFRLSRDQGLSHEEIASRTGLSKSRVKNVMVDTLKLLKEYLAESSELLAVVFWLSYGREIFF